jgi:hypothetical protein
VEPSRYVPVAISGCVVPTASRAVAGVTAIEASAAAVTVTSVLPLTPITAALMVAAPAATPRTSPCEPGLLDTDATADRLEAHAACPVRSCVVPSE